MRIPTSIPGPSRRPEQLGNRLRRRTRGACSSTSNRSIGGAGAVACGAAATCFGAAQPGPAWSPAPRLGPRRQAVSSKARATPRCSREHWALESPACARALPAVSDLRAAFDGGQRVRGLLFIDSCWRSRRDAFQGPRIFGTRRPFVPSSPTVRRTFSSIPSRASTSSAASVESSSSRSTPALLSASMTDWLSSSSLR